MYLRAQSGTGKTATFSIAALQSVDIQVCTVCIFRTSVGFNYTSVRFNYTTVRFNYTTVRFNYTTVRFNYTKV